MSYIPSSGLKGRRLIAQYIISIRQSGITLPYSEYQYIDRWLELGSEDEVLMVLDDILPPLFEKSKGRHPPSLKFAHQQVCRRIINYKKRAHDSQRRNHYENEGS